MNFWESVSAMPIWKVLTIETIVISVSFTISFFRSGLDHTMAGAVVTVAVASFGALMSIMARQYALAASFAQIVTVLSFASAVALNERYKLSLIIGLGFSLTLFAATLAVIVFCLPDQWDSPLHGS